MFSVPVMADTKEDTQSIETQEVQEEAYDWSDKAAAAVNTYANIRSGADINNERVGKLPAGRPWKRPVQRTLLRDSCRKPQQQWCRKHSRA